MQNRTFVYISRWDEFTGEPGIAAFAFDPEQGTLERLGIDEPVLTAGSACLSVDRRVLYVANEIKSNPDRRSGGGGLVWAFRIDPESGALTCLSRVESCCPCPTYLSLDPTGRYLVCANHSSFFSVTRATRRADGTWGAEVVYDDATVDLFRLDDDGGIGPLVDVAKHRTVVDSFMLHSHPHCAVWSPQGDCFACCDKGDDHIYFYRIDPGAERLVLLGEPHQDTPGSAPRCCAFHPTAPWLFVNHERRTTVTSFRRGAQGALKAVSEVDCLPEDTPARPTGRPAPGERPAQQALVMAPDGRTLYSVLNGKGVDGIAVFAVDEATGALRRMQFVHAEGVWARGAALSPDGRFFVLTCLDGGGPVTVYRVGADGTLSDARIEAHIPGGAHVTFVKPG